MHFTKQTRFSTKQEQLCSIIYLDAMARHNMAFIRRKNGLLWTLSTDIIKLDTISDFPMSQFARVHQLPYVLMIKILLYLQICNDTIRKQANVLVT